MKNYKILYNALLWIGILGLFVILIVSKPNNDAPLMQVNALVGILSTMSIFGWTGLLFIKYQSKENEKK